ncbi:MAG TPA: antibiotic biosynthesis monooxygenase [Acidimicrobiales bacterium]|nr:antibiotic biosynthesis monooxygenase [Acidimicrobiales bacterium]
MADPHDGDSPADPTPGPTPDEIELTVVVMRFDAADPERLQAVLAKYVVMSRGHEGCRNIDLLVSVTQPRRHVVVEKWDSPDAQRRHFDSPEMVEMAESCSGILAAPPDIDLYEGISAHDLV